MTDKKHKKIDGESLGHGFNTQATVEARIKAEIDLDLATAKLEMDLDAGRVKAAAEMEKTRQAIKRWEAHAESRRPKKSIKGAPKRSNIPVNQRSTRIESFLDFKFLKITEKFNPTKEDFTKMWKRLTAERREVVMLCKDNLTIRDVEMCTHKNIEWFTNWVSTDKLVGKAILTMKMSTLETEFAKEMYLGSFLQKSKGLKYYHDEIQSLVITDRDHLAELAKKVETSGDGKRSVLKMIIAYGMQVKRVEDAIVDENTGAEIAPMVVALADPKVALSALQEMNRMDHEYGEDDKATSSIEGQAARLRRLQTKIEVASEKQLNSIGKTQRQAASRTKDGYKERKPK